MAYIKKTWMDGDLINASDLNNIENGIKTLEQNTQILGGKTLNVVGERNTFKSGTLLTAFNVQDSSKTTDNYMIGGIFGIFWTGTYFSVGGAIEEAYRTCIDYDRYLDNPAEILFIADTSVQLMEDNTANYLILGSNITMQEAYDELKSEIANGGGKLSFDLHYDDGYWGGDYLFEDLNNKVLLLEFYSIASESVEGTGVIKVRRNSSFSIIGFNQNKETAWRAHFGIATGFALFLIAFLDGSFEELAPIDFIIKVTEL